MGRVENILKKRTGTTGLPDPSFGRVEQILKEYGAEMPVQPEKEMVQEAHREQTNPTAVSSGVNAFEMGKGMAQLRQMGGELYEMRSGKPMPQHTTIAQMTGPSLVVKDEWIEKDLQDSYDAVISMQKQVEQVSAFGKQLEQESAQLQQEYANVGKLLQAYETSGSSQDAEAYLLAVDAYNKRHTAFQQAWAQYEKDSTVFDQYNKAYSKYEKAVGKYLQEHPEVEWNEMSGQELHGLLYDTLQEIENQKRAGIDTKALEERASKMESVLQWKLSQYSGSDLVQLQGMAQSQWQTRADNMGAWKKRHENTGRSLADDPDYDAYSDTFYYEQGKVRDLQERIKTAQQQKDLEQNHGLWGRGFADRLDSAGKAGVHQWMANMNTLADKAQDIVVNGEAKLIELTAKMYGKSSPLYDSLMDMAEKMRTEAAKPSRDAVETQQYVDELRREYQAGAGAIDGFILQQMESVSAMVMDIGMAGMSGQMSGTIGTAMMPKSSTYLAMRATGGGIQHAQEQGYGEIEQILYGTAVGALEWGSEQLFGGNPLYDEGKGLVTKMVEKVTDNPKILRMLYSKPFGVLGEGFEEVFVEFTTPTAEYLFTSKDEIDWASPEEIATAFAGGVFLGLIGTGVEATTNAVGNAKITREFNKLGDRVVQLNAAQGVIDRGLQADPVTDAYQNAVKLQKKLDAGKTITAKDMGKQLMANLEAINAGKLVDIEEVEDDPTVPEGKLQDPEDGFYAVAVGKRGDKNTYRLVQVHSDGSVEQLTVEGTDSLFGVKIAAEIQGMRVRHIDTVQNLVQIAEAIESEEIATEAAPRKGRSEEARKATERKGYESALRIVEQQSEERQAYLRSQYEKYKAEIEALEVGDVLYTADGDVAGNVVSAGEYGVTIVGEMLVERIPAGAFPSDTIVETLLEAGGYFEKNGTADTVSDMEEGSGLQWAGSETQENGLPRRFAPRNDTVDGTAMVEEDNGLQWAGSEIVTPPVAARDDSGVKNAAENNNTETEDMTYGEQSSGRDGARIGKHPGRRAGEDRKRGRARATQRRSVEGTQVRADVKNLGVKPTSLEKLGLSIGSDLEANWEVPRAAWNESIQTAADYAAEHGLKFVPVVGNMYVKIGDKLLRVEAAIENGVIYVQADSMIRDVIEVTLHEIFHHKIGGNKELQERLVEYIQQNYDMEEVSELFDKYRNIYREFIKGMKPDKQAEYIWEEMLADAYAELERFPETEGPVQWSEYVREAMEQAETKNTADGGVRMSAYTAVRERLAKLELDKLSDKLGVQFPLSAQFDAYIRSTKEMVSSPTVTANSVQRNGRSYFRAAKDEFISNYTRGETVNMAGTGIMAALETDVVAESMSKEMKRGKEQVLLDIVPSARELIQGGKLLGVERLIHTNNKKPGLFAYRVYNVFDYESTDIKTKKVTTTPYVFVATIVQQYSGNSIVHIIQGIDVAAYDRGKLGKAQESSPTTGSKYTVAQLYDFVKHIPREDGGLKYTAQEARDYLFNYTQKEDGALYSMAGEGALTADEASLQMAKDMLDMDVSMEEILRTTGWYQGRDGKWRFEIDDSGMTYHRGGDAQFRKDHPEYARYRDLEVAFIEGTITEEETAELRELHETWGKEYARLSERVDRGSVLLENILDHEELFRAYPMLRDTRVVFRQMDDGMLGSYRRSINTIYINESLRNAPQDTLLHEIQHIIQNEEGFAGGASFAYWEDVLRNGLAIRSVGAEKAIAALKAFETDPENADLMEIMERYQSSLLEDDELIPDMIWQEIEDRGYIQDVVAYFDLKDEVASQVRRPMNSVPSELYQNTAGEIEARDVSRRRALTTEERRRRMPDLGNENTVFAEDVGAAWSRADEYDEEAASIKQQLENSRDMLNGMDVVATATVPENLKKKDEAALWAAERLKATGYRVDRRNYGEIYFSKKDMDKGLRYADTPAEKAALAVLPQVLKRGIEIGKHGNHKNREKSTITFAAPVELNGQRGNMAVVVNKNGNHYYAHRIVLPDGSSFVFSDNKENAVQELSRGVTVSGSLADTTSTASGDIISKDADGVNTRFSMATEDANEPYDPADYTARDGHLFRPEGMSSEEYAELDEKWQNRTRPQPERPETADEWIIPKKRFTSTPAMEKLGIKIEGSVTRYRQTEQLRAYERAARQSEAMYRARARKLGPTKTEVDLAKLLVKGTVTADMLSAEHVDLEKVVELADYLAAVESFSEGMVAHRREEINAGNMKIAEELFEDSDEYAPKLKHFAAFTKVRMNYREMERVCRKIFGDEQGEKIYRTYFRPVWVNGAEMNRFKTGWLAKVEKFEDQKGKRRKLTVKERQFAQRLMEGEAVVDTVAKLRPGEQERIKAAAEELNSGKVSETVAREMELNEYLLGVAQAYADYMDSVALTEGMDVVIMKNAIETYREIYNEFYDAINDFLVSHGYNEIGFIKNYAPHFQKQEVQTGLLSALKNMGVEKVAELPASIAGRTADFKPNMKWNPHAQHREGKKTDYDILIGFENYLHYAAEMFYRTDDVMRIRQAVNWFRQKYSADAISKAIEEARPGQLMDAEWKLQLLWDKGVVQPMEELSERQIHERYSQYVDALYEQAAPESLQKYSEFVMWMDDYANILAGKQSYADRGQEAWGRGTLNFPNKLVRQFAVANVAGNLSSALNQTAQLPMIQSQLGWYAELAIKDMMSGRLRKENFRETSDFLTDKRGVDRLSETTIEKFISTLFKPATIMDELTATIAVRGRYLRALHDGMTPEEAMTAADDYGRRTMGSRMKGAKPLAFENKGFWMQMINQFQIEPLNQFDRVTFDGPRAVKAVAQKRGKFAAAKYTAAACVGYLITAFLHNLISEELYGGTPAPFDLLGWLTEFCADLWDETEVEWLKTIFDNAWEKMFGERLFDTTTHEEDENGLDWAGAWDDAKYNLLDDVPLVRNIGSALGYGDQSGPLAGVGEVVREIGSAGKTLKDQLFKGEEETGLDWAGAVKSAGLDMAEAGTVFMPGGRQIRKSIQGIMALRQGGKYKNFGENAALQYPVRQNAWNAIRAGLFGLGPLEETDEFYAGDQALSKNQTKVLKDLEQLGVDRFITYSLYEDFRALDDELTSIEEKNAKRDMIDALELTDEQKKEVYLRTVVSSTGKEKTRAKYEYLLERGVEWSQITQLENAYALLNADEDDDGEADMSSLERGIAKRNEIASLDLTDWQKLEVFDRYHLKHDEDGYEKTRAEFEAMLNEGLSWSEITAAHNTYAELNADGDLSATQKATQYARWADEQNWTNKQVEAVKERYKFWQMIPAEAERYEKFTEAGLSSSLSDKLTKALDTAKGKKGELKTLDRYRVVVDACSTDKEAMTALSAMMSDEQFAKIEIASEFGVCANDWVSFKEKWQRVFGEDSVTQEKVEQVLNSMSISTDRKAALWQIANKSWKPANNPYSRNIGQNIYDRLN